MTTSIHQAGRIVVPKPLRERYGLVPGTEIEIVPLAEGLRLCVRGNTPALVEKDGLLVHHGFGETAGVDSAAFINSQREARAASLPS